MASVASSDSGTEATNEPANAGAPEAHVPAVTSVRAPRMEQRYYASWEEFFSALSEYQDATCQVFRKRTSTSVAARNAELERRGTLTATTKIPLSFEKYYRRLCCTHIWCRPSRSTGKRKNYFVKSTKCEAQLSLMVVWGADKGFQVKVTQQNTTHNHRLGSTSYENHPVNRRVDDADVINFVDELQMAGAKKKLILEYLRRKTGKKVTLRDVHNLVQKLKDARRGSTTVEARLDTILREFCSSRKENTATIYVDDNKLAQTITFQTHQMRRFFEAFPEVLMIDATHNTNDARYKLISFMIHDIFGHGQYVQHALMENESAECLTDAITSFKSFNPTWDRVRVIIVDKDFGEISLLRAAFPGARILLCVFHVVKYLRVEVAKREYGVLDRDKVEDAVHMMLSAQTEPEYETGRKYLYYLVEGKQILQHEDVPDSEHSFLKYFNANWHQCREMWSGYGRVDVYHLGNTTNNRLEAAWGHLKDVLKPTMMLDECVETLMFLQSIAEMEYTKTITDIGCMRYNGADAELEKLAKEVSQHAYQLVEKQYRVANDRKTQYNMRELQAHVFLCKGH
ncbi:hypothetical protein PR001_g7787 [Phytophthora rubi]|uniref:ZSWIM1/3 RNaseH-like domain-containing protein n=2 Tax=Phytophthora rubi TaxID=129364 RepID=A0A6A3N3P0_9STRA|nr:hypothetical protein PR001_g7787 [Phytophthora rubi]